MNRPTKIAALAAGLSALAGGLLADAAGLEGWTKSLLVGIAAGLGVLVVQVAMRSRA